MICQIVITGTLMQLLRTRVVHVSEKKVMDRHRSSVDL